MSEQISAESEKSNSVLEVLKGLSINGEIEEMRKRAKDATYVVGQLALAGQITVFYAGPNTGKTLISLKLIAEAIANGTAGKNVYHINLDDSFAGLIDKTDLGIRHGYYVISPEKFSHPNVNFSELVARLTVEGVADKTVFILDTIKKFVDVMNKKASSEFMATCRKLTSAGGTVIALAHINKHKGENDSGVPAGTSDVLDDCDCAYVIDLISEEKSPAGTTRTVEFRQKKSRGPVAESAVYSYVKNDEGDYNRMFNSVRQVNGNDADELRAKNARQFELDQDADIISAIIGYLQKSGKANKTAIINHIMTSGELSRRKIAACLDRWDQPSEEGGLWTTAKGPSNSSIFTLNTPL